MAQSTLYKIGTQSVSSTVDVTDDDQREVGLTTVKALDDTVDVADDSTREVGQTTVTNTVGVSMGDAILPIDDSVTAGDAFASLDLGPHRSEVDVFYDVANTNNAIVVEVSTDDATWREVIRVEGSDITTGGKLIQTDVAYKHVRAVAEGYADADVNVVEIASKGT